MMITVLSREQVKSVLEMPRVIDAVEQVYCMKANGQTVVWPLVSHEFEHANAVMDIRSGYVAGMKLHGLKMLNNFPNNAKLGIPGFNGMLMIFDSDTGVPLGVLDASYITGMRTGAAGAIAARTLARKDSAQLLVLGAGKQAAFQIAATLILIPSLKRVLVADPLSAPNAQAFVDAVPARLHDEFHMTVQKTIHFEVAHDLAAAVATSDVVITVTPSRKPLIRSEWVKPGTHFSCIGSDMEGKEELEPEIFRGARIFADDKPQCMRVGEMEQPLKQGAITESDIAEELGQVLAGMMPGRTNDHETTIFDATGLALLDLVTGKVAIDLALEKGIGTRVDM